MTCLSEKPGPFMAGPGRKRTGSFGACNRDRRTFVLGNSSFASDVRRREPPGNRHLPWNFVSSSKERLEQAAADLGAGRMKLLVGDDRHDPRSVLCWRAYAVSRASREQVLSGPRSSSKRSERRHNAASQLVQWDTFCHRCLWLTAAYRHSPLPDIAVLHGGRIGKSNRASTNAIGAHHDEPGSNPHTHGSNPHTHGGGPNADGVDPHCTLSAQLRLHHLLCTQGIRGGWKNPARRKYRHAAHGRTNSDRHGHFGNIDGNNPICALA